MLGFVLGAVSAFMGYKQYKSQKKEVRRQREQYEASVREARQERSLLEKRQADAAAMDARARAKRRSSSPFSRSLLRSDDKMMADSGSTKTTLGA